MDKLIEAIERTGNPSVVGLDPKPALIPAPVLAAARAEHGESRAAALAAAYRAFNRSIVDAVAGIVPAVKPQIAMYEALGPAGLQLYCDTCAYARSQSLYVLGDVKRGDIGSTAAQYAAHLGGVPEVAQWGDSFGAEPEDPWHEDAVTLNPYMGEDGIMPFVDVAQAADKDVFVLVRTSNPSSDQVQTLALADGGTVSGHVGELVERWGADTLGAHGYSRVGAVVGATHPEAGAALRRAMPHTFFLIPGYGAQGGSAADVAAMFDANGSGAIVNSSRGIIGAWRKDERAARFAPDADAEAAVSAAATTDAALAEASLDDAAAALDLVADCARQAAERMRDDLVRALDNRPPVADPTADSRNNPKENA